MALKIGIAGPVGSGKTSLIESLTNMLKEKYSLGIVTNDILYNRRCKLSKTTPWFRWK